VQQIVRSDLSPTLRVEESVARKQNSRIFEHAKKVKAARPGSRLRYLLAGQSLTASILRLTFPVTILAVILALPEGK